LHTHGPHEERPSIPSGRAAGPHCKLLNARISTPVLCPIVRYRVALNAAPSAGPDGQIVAHLSPKHSTPPDVGLVIP